MFRLGIFVFLVFAFSVSLSAQGKLNDLTKSNMSFKRTLPTDMYDRNDKKHNEAEKRFNTDNYYDSGKSYYDKDKSFNTHDYYDAQKRATGYDGRYNSPDLRGLDSKSHFYDESKELFFDNRDRNLNKDYSGRSDFSKKKDVEEMTNRVYDDLMDRSMSDINKYHSQTAREDSREAGLPVAPTMNREEESSILDLLDFSTKKIENSSVGFSLPKSMAHMRALPLDDGTAKKDIKQPTPTQNQSQYQPQKQYRQNQQSQRQASQKDPSIPDYSKGYVPPEQKPQTGSDPKKTYTVDRPVKAGDADRSMFGVPKQFNSGKVQISVEVKQK